MLLVLDPNAAFHDRIVGFAQEAGLRSDPILATTRGELEQVIAEGRIPGAVVIGPGIDLPVAITTAAWLQDVVPTAATLLVAVPTTATLRAALRAGFKDVLAPTCSRDEFAEALRGAGYDERDVDGGRAGITVAVFSAKGGVGTSVLASNLAVRLAAATDVECILADLDLPSADQAVLHGVRPSWTVQDIADGVVGDDIDAVAQVLLPVPSTGVQLLAGPTDPAAAEGIGDGVVVDVLHRLRQMAPLVVVDTSSTFSDVTLAVLEQADVIVLVVSLDVLSLRSLSVTMQTFERLGIPSDRLRVVVMRAGAKVGLSTDDVARTTGAVVDVAIPSSRQVATSVNTGVPLAVDSPRSTVVRAVDELVARIVDGATIDGFEGQPDLGRGGLLRRRRTAAPPAPPSASLEPAAPVAPPAVPEPDDDATSASPPGRRRVVRVVQGGREEPAPPPVAAPVVEAAPSTDDAAHDPAEPEPGGLAALPPPQVDPRPVATNGKSKSGRRRTARR